MQHEGFLPLQFQQLLVLHCFATSDFLAIGETVPLRVYFFLYRILCVFFTFFSLRLHQMNDTVILFWIKITKCWGFLQRSMDTGYPEFDCSNSLHVPVAPTPLLLYCRTLRRPYLFEHEAFISRPILLAYWSRAIRSGQRSGTLRERGGWHWSFVSGVFADLRSLSCCHLSTAIPRPTQQTVD